MRAPVYVSVLPGAGAASVRTAADGPPPEAAASGGNGSGGGTDGGGTGGGSSGGGGSGGSGEGGEGEEVGGDAALLAVKQYYRVVGGAMGGAGGDEARAAEAVRVLDSLTFHQALVFCNHHSAAAGLARALCDAGFPAAFVSGEHAQEERSAVVRRMHAFELRVLVCTDLLARGVDFGRVNLVLHLQPPRTLATYLHRVGRTGRFGSLGLSVALLHKREVQPLLAMPNPNPNPTNLTLTLTLTLP